MCEIVAYFVDDDSIAIVLLQRDRSLAKSDATSVSFRFSNDLDERLHLFANVHLIVVVVCWWYHHGSFSEKLNMGPVFFHANGPLNAMRQTTGELRMPPDCLAFGWS